MRWLLLFLVLSSAFAGIFPFDIKVNNRSIMQTREVQIGEHNTIEITIERAPIMVEWYRVRIEPKQFETLAEVFEVPLEGEPKIWINHTAKFVEDVSIPRDFCGKIKVSADVKIYHPDLNHTTQYGLTREFVKECRGLRDRIISTLLRYIPIGFLAKLLS